jgi:ATP-binding cassette subfamily F protein 3
LIKTLKADLEKIEKNISDLEDRVSALETQLTDPEVYADVEMLMKTNQAYEQVKIELEEANKIWEVKAMECERLEMDS